MVGACHCLVLEREMLIFLVNLCSFQPDLSLRMGDRQWHCNYRLTYVIKQNAFCRSLVAFTVSGPTLLSVCSCCFFLFLEGPRP